MLVNSVEFIESAKPMGFNNAIFNVGLNQVLQNYKSSDLTEELYGSIFFVADHEQDRVSIWELTKLGIDELSLSEDHSIVSLKQLMPYFIH